MSSFFSPASQERISSALCLAIGTAGTVFIIECFHLPDSYKSLSLATTLSLLPRPSFKFVLDRFVGLSLGLLFSMFLLTLFFQAPWVSLPLACLIATLGYNIFFKRSGPGSAYSFAAYFLGFYITAIFPGKVDFLIIGLVFWTQSIIPIAVSYAAATLTKSFTPPRAYRKRNVGTIIIVGLTASIAVLLDFTIKIDEKARLIEASISAIAFLEGEGSLSLYPQQMLGYCLGAIVATGFLVPIIALPNEFTIYLLALAGLFGGLEWLACYFLNYSTLFRAAAGMCSFSVCMIPGPDRTFHIAYERMVASMIGFFIAIIVYLLITELVKVTRQFMKPKTAVWEIET